MTLRISGLDPLDPLAVPLPVGTEVTTRVDREVGDRRVPGGAMGRVVAVRGDDFVVAVVGGGEVVYARDELVPRKLGQLGYARRRQAAWDALAGNVVLETVVGSQAWGLADAGSDVDRRGVFVWPFPWTTGLVEPPPDLVSIDGNATYWETGKALRQALRADPNTLEMLFSPHPEPRDPIGHWILEARDAVVSAEIYGTFGRYALSQLKRMRQSLRLAEHRELLLGWLRDDAALTLDVAAERLAATAGIEAPTPRDAVLRARQYIKQLYGSLYDRGLIASRDYIGLRQLARRGAVELELPRELRPKNAYNLIRLIVTATRWLRDGVADFVVDGDLRDPLLAIKRGEVELAAVVARAEALTADLEAARQETALPVRGDVGRVDQLVRRIREEAARRWYAREPGPFGVGAAPLPLATWE